jgi:hypothetical protein
MSELPNPRRELHRPSLVRCPGCGETITGIVTTGEVWHTICIRSKTGWTNRSHLHFYRNTGHATDVWRRFEALNSLDYARYRRRILGESHQSILSMKIRLAEARKYPAPWLP